jgi:hypothetical protein
MNSVIETLPHGWDSGADMGEWHATEAQVGAAWRTAFVDFLAQVYPTLSLIRNEIVGPAGSDIEPTIYDHFKFHTSETWCELIQGYLAGVAEPDYSDVVADSSGAHTKTAHQMADEMRASTSEYVTYGQSDIGIPVLRTTAIADIETMDDDSIGDGTWHECDSEGNVVE